MAQGRRSLYLVVSIAILFVLLFAGGHLIAVPRPFDPPSHQASAAFMAAAALAAVLLFIVAIALHRFVFSPLVVLAREIRIISGANPAHIVDLPSGHLLGDVPEAVNELGRSFMAAKRELFEAASAISGEAEHSRSSLEIILMSLKEAVLVCDERARILFYNTAAREVFRSDTALGLGRSLYLLCATAPVESALALLKQRRARHAGAQETDLDVSFVCSTRHGAVISCRMRLLPAAPGLSWSFLFTCEDISREADAAGRRVNVLRSTVRKMRSSLTNMNLSIESTELLPDLDPVQRSALDRTLAEETRNLVREFEILSREVQQNASPRHAANDILADDVAACVAKRLEKRGIRLTTIGDPLWVNADVHSLILVLEFFATRIQEHQGVDAMEVETLLGDRRVYFTYLWEGRPITQAELREWVAMPVEPSSSRTVEETIEALDSEVWSRPHASAGYSVLCLPLPLSASQWEQPVRVLPSRPVYRDFLAMDDAVASTHFRDQPLDRLPFVVFDTETTGLAPLAGDAIVSLAGVKIVNMGIILGETFDRLVDPGRSIPPESIRFHGITDEMVRGRPPIEAVLREFQSFVGDAVLVGHNAAFDMRFIRLKEERAGVRFSGPVLDTLTLSLALHGHAPEHSLDAVAKRMGVEVRDRHTAFGDALITAQVFIKFIYLFREKKITTLKGLMEAVRR